VEHRKLFFMKARGKINIFGRSAVNAFVTRQTFAKIHDENFMMSLFGLMAKLRLCCR
jgi:hypothetical protein